ncbi:hypothetical protein QBC38DRAFT_366621 [Podospora fimiseda]|uniref:Uncharacterized protein n=1 Tax=Podospora fimiseda TaxID=252190 RepID=A0AAN7BN36_9PEZI|nr:hypothetical protein QBC38DRAFT_366621 [Podospora fimiseda]
MFNSRKAAYLSTKTGSWRWWELGATFLSIISLVLVVAILFLASNRSLEKWAFPIQPNFLVAVFTTLGKSAMMVSITSSLSQLKWQHFSQKHCPLSHLDILDEASRGPWGSFTLLFRLRSIALLPCVFTFVTLASLGIEPAAQQILEFRTRRFELDLVNQTAEFSMATT